MAVFFERAMKRYVHAGWDITIFYCNNQTPSTKVVHRMYLDNEIIGQYNHQEHGNGEDDIETVPARCEDNWLPDCDCRYPCICCNNDKEDEHATEYLNVLHL